MSWVKKFRWCSAGQPLMNDVDDRADAGRAPTTTAAAVDTRPTTSRSTTIGRGLANARHRGVDREEGERTSRRRSRACRCTPAGARSTSQTSASEPSAAADPSDVIQSSGDATRPVLGAAIRRRRRGAAAAGRRDGRCRRRCAVVVMVGHVRSSVAAPLRLRLTKTAAIVLTTRVIRNSTKPAVSRAESWRLGGLAEVAGDQRRDGLGAGARGCWT